ncbi:MAG TPA: hypothetical protein ENN49_09070 [Bacteroidales bacterium]|nr:hypothetical protein [Bacteroidales bacterium]
MKRYVLLLALILLAAQAFACTTAIISGKATPDGRPLLWKHRDANDFNNKIVFEAGARFRYLALINSNDPERQAWAGANSAGFAIMNSASYNIKPKTDSTKVGDLEGHIINLAPGRCATITQFAIMWVKLGFQPAPVAIPLWVGARGILPDIITAPDGQNAKLCDFALKLKKDCFPLSSWAKGENYVLLSKLINKEQTGLIQLTNIFDKEIIARTKTIYDKWTKFEFNPTKTYNFYLTLNRDVEKFYKIHFDL